MLLLLPLHLHAGDSTIVSFSVGNKYVYGGNQHCPGGIITQVSYSETIFADTLINGRQYFEFLRFPAIWSLVAPTDTAVLFYRRADSTAIYQYDIKLGKEDTLVNFSDTIGRRYNSGFQILGRENTYFFGALYSSIFMSPDEIIYAPKLFLVHYWPEYFCSEEFTLEAAKINGVYYGDSTVLSVKSKLNSISLPSDYVLFQNYPNPFNPATQIEYYIPHSGYVLLIVQDVLGRHVATLVNEEVSSGHHTVTFDGSSYSSGIYYYTLQGGSSIQTKKLILLK